MTFPGFWIYFWVCLASVFFVGTPVVFWSDRHEWAKKFVSLSKGKKCGIEEKCEILPAQLLNEKMWPFVKKIWHNYFWLYQMLSDNAKSKDIGNRSTDHLGQLITKKIKSTDHQTNGGQFSQLTTNFILVSWPPIYFSKLIPSYSLIWNKLFYWIWFLKNLLHSS